MKRKAAEFHRTFTALQLDLALTKMRCAEVVMKAQRTREHVQRSRAQRNGLAWSPEDPPTFVTERSAQVQ